MYRIFCESYQNYINMFHDIDSKKEYRYILSAPIALIVDLEKYHREKSQDSAAYKELCDLLYYMKCNLDKYPKFNSFSWILEAMDIKPECTGISEPETLAEQAKMMNLFLNLAYWN